VPTENTLVIPKSWRAERYPRPGSGTVSVALSVDPGTVLRRLFQDNLTVLGPVLDAPKSDPLLGEAGRRYLSWLADRSDGASPTSASNRAEPEGAAVLLRVLAGLPVHRATAPRQLPQAWQLVDSWVELHGLAFTVEAVVAAAGLGMQGLTVSRLAGRERESTHLDLDHRVIVSWRWLALRLRMHLAVLPGPEYEAIVDLLAGYRGETLHQRVVTAFLAPTQLDWVAADCAELAAAPLAGVAWLALLAGCPAEHLLPISAPLRWSQLPLDVGALTTIMLDSGPGAASAFAAWYDQVVTHHDPTTEKARRLIEALAQLPTDEAFLAVLVRAEPEWVLAQLIRMADRFPDRALRILAERDEAVAARVLERLVVAKPQLAADLLGELSESGRERVGALLNRSDRRPDAAREALPKALTPARAARPLDWVDPMALPQVLTRDGTHRLPAAALIVLIRLLMKYRRTDDAARASLGEVRDACDPDTLAEFGWQLCLAWLTPGVPTAGSGIVQALGMIGTPVTAERLIGKVGDWHSTGSYARADMAMAAITEIGTDAGLWELDLMSRRSRQRSLREKAGGWIKWAANQRGCSGDELSDQVVPDLGLTAGGRLELDYGPRRFTVRFDATSKPVITDPDGRSRAVLPLPAARDHTELAEAARARYGTVRKEVGIIVADQVRRLELALVNQRRWRLGGFQELLVDHPLIGTVGRRLLWGVFDGRQLVQAFRIDDERAFVDLDDDPVPVPVEASIGLVHPVSLGARLTDWQQVFTEYEIIQPLAQLHRAVHRLTTDERTSTVLTRFAGTVVVTRNLRALIRPGGWEQCYRSFGLDRELPAGQTVVLRADWDPGSNSLESELAEVWISPRPRFDVEGTPPLDALPFSVLDEVTASEILRDLTDL